MNIIKTDIEGILIIESRLFRDARGYFFESFSEREFEEKVAPILGHNVHFCQDNESMSSYGVMRGLHFQRPPYNQSKLVRCVKGRVLDVAVDIRKGSPTYGKHVAVELTENNNRQFFIPKGFAYGFAVLSETAVFQYKCDNFYHDAPREVSRHLRRYDTRGKGDAQEDLKAKGEYIPEVIYVNGMRQYSASNRKYVSPKL